MAEENDDPGTVMPLTIAGQIVVSIIARAADYVECKLADGRRAVVPISHGDYARAAALPDEAMPPIVPSTISNAQFRAALRAAGRTAAMLTYLNSASDAAKDFWQFSPVIPRNSQMVADLRTALSLSNAQVDNFFVTAAAITF